MGFGLQMCVTTAAFISFFSMVTPLWIHDGDFFVGLFWSVSIAGNSQGGVKDTNLGWVRSSTSKTPHLPSMHSIGTLSLRTRRAST